MSPRQQLKLRWYPYSVALGLFVSWLVILFLAHSTVNILRDLKVEVSDLQILGLRCTMGWQGWLAPYFVAAIAVIIRWPSRLGWFWGLILCLVSDFVALTLLSLQIEVFNIVGQPYSPPTIPAPVLLCLSAGVLILLQAIGVSMLFNRRLFFSPSALKEDQNRLHLSQ